MSETVTFKLNGENLTVPKGWTVMKAAKQAAVKIPNFCWHPGLSVAGACRFCMVHVEGARKLEVACNLPISEGMVVKTDTDEVKEAHKWALEFHLINHPLDCPICDQAGECGLQNYYMEVGKYKSQMHRPKVLKPKANDVGSELILDSERCILCSRCVRFENEVTQSSGLGIFDRGDRAIIGTYDDEKIEHKYQENLVDICPVGAFTSKKFRFKQRVWFLKEQKSICPGCSTGCHIDLHAKPQVRRYYRIKPRFKEEVNGHWMCDKGRTSFEHLNPEHRLANAYTKKDEQSYSETSPDKALEQLAKKLSETSPKKISLLVSPQYTNEEYEALFGFFVGKLGVKKVFQWREPSEDLSYFDKLLLRGDQNPNTAGLMNIFEKYQIKKEIKDESTACLAESNSCMIALSPEVPFTFPNLETQLKDLAKSSAFVSLWSLHYKASQINGFEQIIPLKGFSEKTGSFTNVKGQLGTLDKPFGPNVSEAKDVCEIIKSLEEKIVLN